MIVLDLDGVLANFSQAAHTVHGLPVDTVPTEWNWYRQFGITDDTFWNLIHQLGDKFYGEMVRPYWWWNVLLDEVAVADDYVVMTSPSKAACGYAGKFIWAQKYLPESTELIVGSAKHLLAGPERLLIDDNETNCERFEAAGGRAFLFPQPWNRNRDLLQNRFEALAEELDHWKGRVQLATEAV